MSVMIIKKMFKCVKLVKVLPVQRSIAQTTFGTRVCKYTEPDLWLALFREAIMVYMTCVDRIANQGSCSIALEKDPRVVIFMDYFLIHCESQSPFQSLDLPRHGSLI